MAERERPYELLVHATAPLVRNEALYRSMAAAYFDFTADNDGGVPDAVEDDALEADRQETMSAANSESESQELQHDTIQLGMSSQALDSWKPDSQLDIDSAPKKTYLTRSKLVSSSGGQRTEMASQQSFAGSTWNSTLDGMNSPRFKMPKAMEGPAYQYPEYTQSLTRSFNQPASQSFSNSMYAPRNVATPPQNQSGSSSGFVPPPSTVQDSYTQGQGYNPIPRFSTSEAVMESFLSYFHSGSENRDAETETGSSPTLSRSQRSQQASLRTNRPTGSFTQRSQVAVSFDSEMADREDGMRSSVLDDGREVPMVSPPKPRRRVRQTSPTSGQPIHPESVLSTALGNGKDLRPRSQALSSADPVSPAPSHGDELPAITHTSPATIRAERVQATTPQQQAAPPALLSVPNRAIAAISSTPTPPDTPSRGLRKRRATNTSIPDSPSRPSKRPATQVSRLQEVSEVLQTPIGPPNGAKNAAPQVPFTGSFNLPAHQLSRVRNASFDEGISRISDTPLNGATSNKELPPPRPSNGASKPHLPLHTSISVVPDTPTPAPAPTRDKSPPQSQPIPPSSSALPLPSAPPSSFLPITKSSKPSQSSKSSTSTSTHTILAPPPSVSTTPLPSHRTSFLIKLTNQLSLSRYNPVSTTRELRKHERGYWVFSLPDGVGGWDKGRREEMWDYLSKFIGKGRAGWGVSCYRAGWEGGALDGGKEMEGNVTADETGWRGEEWRVYCWGEVVGEIWLLLFLASSRRVRGLGARWRDGGGEVVVQMGGERRVRDV